MHIANCRTMPATSHTMRRAANCTTRVPGRRGRSQLRNHTSTKCPPSDGHKTSSVMSGQRATPARERNAISPPTMTAMDTVRTSVLRTDSWYGCAVGGGVIPDAFRRADFSPPEVHRWTGSSIVQRICDAILFDDLIRFLQTFHAVGEIVAAVDAEDVVLVVADLVDASASEDAGVLHVGRPLGAREDENRNVLKRRTGRPARMTKHEDRPVAGL